MKYPNITMGCVEAVWNKLGGEEGVKRFLSGKLVVTEPVRCWHEEDGVIYFSVTSDGTTGEEWIKRLEKKGFLLGGHTERVLRSLDFHPTEGVTTEVAVLKGTLFGDSNRITSKIRENANKRKLTNPNAEVACLIREMFSDEELEAMGLWWIVVFHESIRDSDGCPSLLGVSRDDNGRWFGAFYDRLDDKWSPDDGFAFAVSQVSL